jgi:two-component system, NtrC family, sensor kinase
MPFEARTDASAKDAELVELLRYAERRAAMARIASALAHMVGTPLNVISGRAALISQLGSAQPDAAKNNAAVIERQVEQLVERIQRALRYLRSEPMAPEACGLVELLRTARELNLAVAGVRGVELAIEEGGDEQALVHRCAVLQVLSDLVSLGLRVTKKGGRIVLTTRREHAEPPASERGRAAAGKMARFFVRLVGVKLPSEMFQQPYEPWNTADSADADLVLILTVCFGLSREHAAWIDVDEKSGDDTTLTLSWPCF